jgi:hypothetical protein
MTQQYDFQLSRNWRGWSVIRPLTTRASAYALRYFDPLAREIAERFGDEDGEEWWYEARDALDVALCFIDDGLTCENSDKIKEDAE